MRARSQAEHDRRWSYDLEKPHWRVEGHQPDGMIDGEDDYTRTAPVFDGVSNPSFILPIDAFYMRYGYHDDTEGIEGAVEEFADGEYETEMLFNKEAFNEWWFNNARFPLGMADGWWRVGL